MGPNSGDPLPSLIFPRLRAEGRARGARRASPPPLGFEAHFVPDGLGPAYRWRMAAGGHVISLAKYVIA